ncbi:RNA 2',3'-cyclic phosphodiesterase [Salipaludibacillus sp. HK11]|uniref:RNA 2',3'-cyclic phosphodiesterase n=1 Tax=Salipaludibacillus sp. HK11 TaxID=3394320 RepID=UPI0039FCDAD6
MKQIHTFIGIPIAETISTVGEEIQKSYQLRKYYKKTVNKEDFHITLLFLGSWEMEKRVKLCNRLELKLGIIKNFPISFTKVDYFGNENHPRVFYLGIEAEIRLNQLQAIVKSEAEQMGFQEFHRKYHPHVTLAKKWYDESQSKPVDWELPAKITNRQQTIDKICLYQIHPSRESMYERVSSISLLMDD